MPQSNPSEPNQWPGSVVRSGIALADAGFVLGAYPILVRGQSGALLETDADRDRLLALLSIAYRRPVSADVLIHAEAAAAHWANGDRTLANFRLAYARLPPIDDPGDRLRLADRLLDRGMTPRALLKALDLDPGVLEKRYNPSQPRVPAGNGQESGRWAALWAGLTGWLAEPVPEYDQDTGDEVGTRSRGYAIATNPITIGIAGVAALVGAETLAVAGEAVALGSEAAVLESEVATAASNVPGFLDHVARGLASEAKVLKEMGFVKNTRAVATEEGMAIPDILNAVVTGDIKDVMRVAATRQIRIMTKSALREGKTSLLVTGDKTYITKTAVEAFGQIIRRPDLGPR
jgi:hypothetical protein